MYIVYTNTRVLVIFLVYRGKIGRDLGYHFGFFEENFSVTFNKMFAMKWSQLIVDSAPVSLTVLICDLKSKQKNEKILRLLLGCAEFAKK